MKKYIYILVALIPTLIIPCASPQSGQRVWNIATKNIFITQAIESSLDGVSSIDTITAFSNLDQLLDRVTIVESKASLLLQEIDHLQSNLIEDLSQTEQIQSNIQIIESSLALLDLSSVFTALDTLETTIVSAMDLLNTDFETIVTQIDALAALEVQYFQTVASQLDKLDDDVVMVSSLLDGLDAQFSLSTLDSITDLLHQELVMLESNVDILADQLDGGFAGTFSVLDQNLLLAQTVESLADTLDVMDDSDLTGTYSLLDQLEISVQTMDSLVDLLIATFENIESTIDILGSALDESVSKYMFVESRTSLLVQKIEELVNNPAFSTVDHATSLLDRDISLLEHAYTADLPALTNSIESKLDHVIAQQEEQLSDLDTVAAAFSRVAMVLHETIDISKLSLVNSLLDDTIDDAFATESYLDPATHIEQLFVVSNNAQNLREQISFVDVLVPQISSKMLLIDDLLATTDSTLDIIDTIAQSNLDNAITLDSIIDTLSFVAQPSDSISSILDVTSSQEDIVISKLSLASNIIASENSQAQGLIGDFQSTWTILQAIDTKLAQAYSSLSLADVAIDAKFVSYSSVFTMIDTIVRNEATINSQVDVYNSMVNVLTSNINTDFNGVFTTLTDINNSMANSSNTLSGISSKLSVVQTELGFPIYQSDIPLTINTSGRYFFAENINFAAASGTAITINTSNVTLDLNNKKLEYTGAGTGVVGIQINSVSNTKIINGNTIGFPRISLAHGNIVTATGSTTTNIILKNVGIVNGVMILNTSGRNHKIYNCFLSNDDTNPQLGTIAVSSHTNVAIIDSIFLNSYGIQLNSANTVTNFCVEKCVMTNNGTVFPTGHNSFGFDTSSLTVRDFLIKNVNVINGFRGIDSFTTVTITGVDILSSCFMGMTNTAINLLGSNNVLKSNTIVGSLAGIQPITTINNQFIGFNNFIQNTSNNVRIPSGANTVLGNFAFNTNAVGSPNNTNYNVSGSTTNITGKFVTISQRTGISGSTAPTYWHNINMLP